MSASSIKIFADRILNKSQLWLMLYLLTAPVTISLAVFSYYPKWDVVVMSFYRWEPSSVQEYVGLRNFEDAFADPQFWNSFYIVGLLFLANLFKMWPGIIAAIALHRLYSDKMRYFFQVAFVVPMIIPAIVGLLVWKSFYDPSLGLLNQLLNATGMMQVLNFLDTGLPYLSDQMDPFFASFMDPVFGGVMGLAMLGGLIWIMSKWTHHEEDRFGSFAVIIALSTFPLLAQLSGLFSTGIGIGIFVALVCIGFFFLERRLDRAWVIWPFLILGGYGVFWAEPWRFPIAVLIGFAAYEYCVRKYDHFTTEDYLSWSGIVVVSAASLLALVAKIWIEPTGQFAAGTPAWLGSKDLVIPAVLFWGFPWVGTVGVLIYLSGLQNISQDVYEAAELDGVSPWGMIWHIELPLIMTQIRINLIFMTIATLTGYEFFLLLLGPDGGPGNKGMVPGLYLFSSAFSEGKFGYGCALGMVLFVIILTLTIIYQKYVKVDK